MSAPPSDTARRGEQREAVRQMLAGTQHVDTPPTEGACPVRCYQMTEKEYQAARPFRLTVLFAPPGCQVPEQRPFAGYCYDLRELLRGHHLTLDGKTSSLPLPISSARWELLRQNDPRLPLYSQRPGVLDYPLSHGELFELLRHLRNQPVLCSAAERCVSLNESDRPLQLLFDAAPTLRYGPTTATADAPVGTHVEQTPSAPRCSVWSNAPGGAEQSAILRKARENALKDLERVDVDSAAALQELDDPSNLAFCQRMLESGSSELHISSYLVTAALQAFLRGRPPKHASQQLRQKPLALRSA